MSKGGWVFISHSHQDIDLVRKIRNHFERLGFEPLMFYLKFISDNNPNAEWYFSWFSDSDFTDIDEFAFKINAKEYEKVQIDTL